MKKGFIYITTVIVFLVVLMSLFYAHEIYKPGSKDDTVEARIRTMNDFINDLEVDTERAAYISGFRSLIALEEFISDRGEFLLDMESSFKEAFLNGTIEGNFSPKILNESSFSLYLQRVNQKSGDIDINMDLSIIEINFSQADPWTVRIDILSNISIVDDRGLAEWTYEDVFTSDILIFNFKDPLYTVNTLGRFPNFVVQTNITEFVQNNNTDNLTEHMERGYYKASINAPSFVQRFENDLNSNIFGIESLIDISFLQDQEDITIDLTKSVVDHIYFGNQTTNNKCNINNMPPWFKIDENHISDYEINELTYINCT